MKFYTEIESHMVAGLPLVAYRKPREKVIYAVLQNSDELNHVADFSESGFIFAPFDIEKGIVLLRADKRLCLESYSSYEANDSTNLPRDIEYDVKKDEYLAFVKKGIAKIDEGALQKVVLSRCFGVDVEASPLELFKRLLSTYSKAFCYIWYHPKIGLWLGATPEILLTLKNKKLATMSLAGTQAYMGTEDISWGQKELEEQALVTDYILNALEHRVSNLEQSAAESVRAGKLWHLRTRISGTLEHGELGNIIKTLHPTPAVCGLPRANAQEFINTHEGYDREFYTGFLGELNFNSSRFQNEDTIPSCNLGTNDNNVQSTLYVNLRCMKIVSKRAIIYVGGGITRRSDPHDEWQETIEKSKTILRVIHNL